MGDEIERANEVQVFRHGSRWFAQVGPDRGGLVAYGTSPEVAVSHLMVKCRELGWVWDESWKPR